MSLTLVTFHAHPDDEAIATAGTMARAKAEGHRVVLVVATRGELGEPVPGVLARGETLRDRRVAETFASADILGVDRVEFLGYHDSGMPEVPGVADAFARAEIDDAAKRLATLLAEERADVLTVYDDNGGYGHPDHIQVHRVGIRAAHLAGTRRVVETTLNRDHIRRLMQLMPINEIDASNAPDPADIDTLGVTEDRITTTVDVRDFVELKRAAMAAHASQIAKDHFFLSMPDEAFREAFGWEWFIRRDAPPGAREASVFEGLD